MQSKLRKNAGNHTKLHYEPVEKLLREACENSVNPYPEVYRDIDKIATLR
jgi:hypothetical protein